MSYFAAVAGEEVVSSGIVFSKQGEELTLFPFGSDATYKLVFAVFVVEGEDSTPEVKTRIGDGFYIDLYRPWLDGKTSVNLDVLIARTETHEYSMSFSVTPIGNVERYANQFIYSVKRRMK